MADISVDEIDSVVNSVLPLGSGDGQITEDHIHKMERAPSTRDIASSELDAVTVEFRHNPEDAGDAVTSKIHNSNTITELEQSLRNALPDEYDLVDMNLEQYNRLLYEVRAPLEG